MQCKLRPQSEGFGSSKYAILLTTKGLQLEGLREEERTHTAEQCPSPAQVGGAASTDAGRHRGAERGRERMVARRARAASPAPIPTLHLHKRQQKARPPQSMCCCRKGVWLINSPSACSVWRTRRPGSGCGPLVLRPYLKKNKSCPWHLWALAAVLGGFHQR